LATEEQLLVVWRWVLRWVLAHLRTQYCDGADRSRDTTKTLSQIGKCEECKGPDDHGGDQGQGGSPLAAGWCKEVPAGGELVAKGEENLMLWTIAAILAILWLLGWVSSYTIGGLIHLLLVIALIMVLVAIIQGRRLT
jgi:hypothetical protein